MPAPSAHDASTTAPLSTRAKSSIPMMVIHKIKDHIKDKGQKKYELTPAEILSKAKEGIKNGHVSPDTFQRDDGEFPELAGGVISTEELMACTTCGACVANCPVLIEHVDTIIDMRRYLVLTEVRRSRAEVTPHLQATSKTRPTRGASQTPNGRIGPKGSTFPAWSELRHQVPEYLFWVGCAGSFDDRQKKVTDGPCSRSQSSRRLTSPSWGPTRSAPETLRVESGTSTSTGPRRLKRTSLALNEYGRHQDHHGVPSLLPHHRQRVPAARWSTTRWSTIPRC